MILPYRSTIPGVNAWHDIMTACLDPVDASIVTLAAAGYTRRETAARTGISPRSVYRRLAGILARYHAADAD